MLNLYSRGSDSELQASIVYKEHKLGQKQLDNFDAIDQRLGLGSSPSSHETLVTLGMQRTHVSRPPRSVRLATDTPVLAAISKAPEEAGRGVMWDIHKPGSPKIGQSCSFPFPFLSLASFACAVDILLPLSSFPAHTCTYSEPYSNPHSLRPLTYLLYTIPPTFEPPFLPHPLYPPSIFFPYP
jgi:hypothetical protein